MALLFPFLTTDEGIKTNVLRKDILSKFISPPIPKEIYSLDNTSIIKEIDKERIYRKNIHLLSLKLEIIYERIVDQLIDLIFMNKGLVPRGTQKEEPWREVAGKTFKLAGMESTHFGKMTKGKGSQKAESEKGEV